jgi:hypothetical protein
MAQYEHLPLRRLEGALERRLQRGFGEIAPRDAKGHGEGLSTKVETVVASHKAKPKIADIDPALILKIETTGGVSEETWAAMGLTILSNDTDKSVILFADDGELQEFKRRIAEYQKDPPAGQKNPTYASLIGALESISELTPADRIGAVLRSEGITRPQDFPADVADVFDLELWQPDSNSVIGFVSRIEFVVQQHGGTIINEYKGRSMTLVRVRGSGDAIRALLDLPELSVLDRPPQPDLPQFDASSFDLNQLGPVQAPPAGSPVIGIIDSGLNSAHPLMEGAVAGAFGVPANLGDDDTKGHGTSVSGIAVFGDLRARIEQGTFEARCFVASAKVVNQHGKFSDEVLVPTRMDEAIRRLVADYGCRVINISLGDRKRMAGEKPSPWAAVLDDLARELDLVIVVSAGNRDNLSKFGDRIADAYPACLRDDEARILEPGTAVNVLTVGSLAHSNGLGLEDEELVGVMPLTEIGWPSPFSRTGPGAGKVIKPDFVDYGGTLVFDGPTQTLMDGRTKPAAGVISLNQNYITRMLTSVSGTSFAAPLTAYKAALVRDAFPDASANLVKALLAVSAEWPDSITGCLADLTDEQKYNVIGHGVIDVERALSSDDNRVVLFREDNLDVDRFAVFEVPVPEQFQSERGRRHIRIALCFDPIVRHTRLDYAGLSMSFDLFRGASAEQVFDACRKWQQAEGDPFRLVGASKCQLTPATRQRSNGALQCGTFVAKRSLEAYGDKYYVAVRCEGGWAAEITGNQRFALAVELQHEADIQIYQQIQAQVQVQVQV